MMDKLQIVENIFSNYTYECVRPSVLPNNEMLADTSNFIGWYVETFLNIPSANRSDIFTWTIFEDFEYAKKIEYMLPISEINRVPLKEDDIILFSINKTFDTPDYNNYWGGIYISEDVFLNFNGIEGLGKRPLMEYVNDKNTSYGYFCVIRVHRESMESRVWGVPKPAGEEEPLIFNMNKFPD